MYIVHVYWFYCEKRGQRVLLHLLLKIHHAPLLTFHDSMRRQSSLFLSGLLHVEKLPQKRLRFGNNVNYESLAAGMYRFPILGRRLVLVGIMVVQITIYVETALHKFYICSFRAVLPNQCS